METGRAPSHVALNRKDLELLCSKISEDRILLAAQTARLMFLTQPSDHPHRGKIWTKGIPDFALVERAGTPPFWAKPLGENLSWSCYRTKDGKELAWYDVFLAGKEKAMMRFREICYASAALLFSDADIPESVFVPELFEFCRLNGLLKWEINEEPNHPETRGQIAWLHDLFAATLLFLNAQFKSPEKPTEAVANGSSKRSQEKAGTKPLKPRKSDKSKRYRGPNVTDDEAKSRRSRVADWQRWKAANPKVRKPTKRFCEDETAVGRPIDPPTLKQYVNWVTKNPQQKRLKRP